MKLLERAIAAVAPERALRRARARFAAETIHRHLDMGRRTTLAPMPGTRVRRYEGAGRGRRFDGWVTPGGGPNAEIRGALEILRARSRDLVANNQWASKAVRVLSSRTIGTGIRPQARHESKGTARRAQDLWREWAETKECDARGKRNVYGLQRTVHREVVEAGECLVRRRFRRPSDGLTVPMQLEILEPDHLDSSRDRRLTNGGRIVQGVQFTPIGGLEGYWLFPEHPGEDVASQSRFVRAADVLHVFREDRAGQVRGVPWGSCCILKLRDADELDDAELLRRKIASCFVGFMQDNEAGIDGDTSIVPTVATGEDPTDMLDHGTIEILPPGKEMTFTSPPNAEGYVEVANLTLRAIAAGYGVTYEALTGDLHRVSFTSGRMGWLEMWAEIVQHQHLELLPTLCSPIWRWFVDAAVDSGQLGERVGARWTMPRRPYLDPRKEVLAQKDAIRAGLTTLPEEIRGQGRDPLELLDEAAEFQAEAEARGLVLDTDLSGNVTPAGAASSSSSGARGLDVRETARGLAALLVEGNRELEDLEVDLAEQLEQLVAAGHNGHPRP